MHLILLELVRNIIAYLYYCDANQSNTFININLPPNKLPNDTFFVLGNFNDFEFDYKHKMEKISD
jgi:hypothetical protein